MYIENLDLPHKILDRNIEIINKSVEKLLVAMGNHWDMTQDDEHLEVPWNLGHIAEEITQGPKEDAASAGWMVAKVTPR